MHRDLRLLALGLVAACTSACNCGAKPKQPGPIPVVTDDGGSNDAGSNDAGTIADAGTSDAGTPDAGMDAGQSDAGDGGLTMLLPCTPPPDELEPPSVPPPGATAIVEDFADAGALDLSTSTAIVSGGALVAPVDAFATSDCTAGDWILDGGASPTGTTLTIDGGIFQYGTVDVRNATITVNGDLDIRTCGDFSMNNVKLTNAHGFLHVTSWSKLTLNRDDPYLGVGGLTAQGVLLATADGGTLTQNQYVESFTSDPDGGNDFAILSTGDYSLSDTVEHDRNLGPDTPLRITAAGSIRFAPAPTQFTSGAFVETGASRVPSAPMLIRAGGDIDLLPGTNGLANDNSSADENGNIELTAGGSIHLAGRENIYVSGANSAIRLHARGDVSLLGQGLDAGNPNTSYYVFNDNDDVETADAGNTIDVLANGTATIGWDVVEAGATRNVRRSAHALGAHLEVRASRVVVNGLQQVAGSGPLGAPGDAFLLGGDGGVFVDTGPAFVANECVAGSSVTIESCGDAVVTNVLGGDSIDGGLPDGGGCFPGPGGAVTVRALGAVTATGLDGGMGSTQGAVNLDGGAFVADYVPRVELTEPFWAYSRVYDLTSAQRIVAVKKVTLPAPPEGGVRVELSMADAAGGPWSAWHQDASLLGAHRYFRWRARVDRYFFRTAGLDRLEIYSTQ